MKAPTLDPTKSTMFSDADFARLQKLLDSDSLQALLALKNGDDMPAELYDIDGCEADYDCFSDISINQWDDDCGEMIYQFGKHAFAHYSHGKWAGIWEAKNITEYLGSWCWDDYGSREQMFVAFGLDVDLNEATESYIGKCMVWIAHNYFPGTLGIPRDEWAIDENHEQLIFDSYSSAQDWIEQADDASRVAKSETNPRGSYLLQHGEMEPRTYTICEA